MARKHRCTTVESSASYPPIGNFASRAGSVVLDAQYTSKRGFRPHQLVTILSENVASTTRVHSGKCTLSAETSRQGRSRRRGIVYFYTATMDIYQHLRPSNKRAQPYETPRHRTLLHTTACTQNVAGKQSGTAGPDVSASNTRVLNGMCTQFPEERAAQRHLTLSKHRVRTQRHARAINREASGHSCT